MKKFLTAICFGLVVAFLFSIPGLIIIACEPSTQTIMTEIEAARLLLEGKPIPHNTYKKLRFRIRNKAGEISKQLKVSKEEIERLADTQYSSVTYTPPATTLPAEAVK